MKEKYLIEKNYFIDEFNKLYKYPYAELSLRMLFVGKCGKYEIRCDYYKKWFLYDVENKDWIDIEPIMLPDNIYERDKHLFEYQYQYPLNDVEIMLRKEGATDEFILDLCELIDMLNDHLVKDVKIKY